MHTIHSKTRYVKKKKKKRPPSDEQRRVNTVLRRCACGGGVRQAITSWVFFRRIRLPNMDFQFPFHDANDERVAVTDGKRDIPIRMRRTLRLLLLSLCVCVLWLLLLPLSAIGIFCVQFAVFAPFAAAASCCGRCRSDALSRSRPQSASHRLRSPIAYVQK